MVDQVLVNSKNFSENFVNQYSALVGSSFERLAWKNNVTANASITTIDIHNGSTCVWPSRVTIIAGATTVSYTHLTLPTTPYV